MFSVSDGELLRVCKIIQVNDSSKAKEIGMRSSRRGRPHKAPSTRLASFLQDCLDARGFTRQDLAERIDVSAATVTRLLNGDTTTLHSFTLHDLRDALSLDDREYQIVTRLADEHDEVRFSITTGAQPRAATRARQDLLELAEDHAGAIERLLAHGHGHYRYIDTQARRWHERLMLAFPETRDVQMAKLQLRFGLLSAGIQQVLLPWYQRHCVIHLYNQLEADIILRFPLDTFAHEYVSLLSHRAPLYRELGSYRKSIDDFEAALSLLHDQVADPLLRTTVLRNRAHVHASLGNEHQWKVQLGEALADAERMTVRRDEAIEMITYIEGEGYKRLAFQTRRILTLAERVRYAGKAMRCFELALARPREAHTSSSPDDPGAKWSVAFHTANYTNGDAYRLLARAAEAQCLIWVEPDTVGQHIARIRDDAAHLSPSLLDKLALTQEYAQQRLDAKRSDAAVIFDLDARAKDAYILQPN